MQRSSMSLQGKTATDSKNLAAHYASALGNSFRNTNPIARTVSRARSVGSRSRAIAVSGLSEPRQKAGKIKESHRA